MKEVESTEVDRLLDGSRGTDTIQKLVEILNGKPNEALCQFVRRFEILAKWSTESQRQREQKNKGE